MLKDWLTKLQNTHVKNMDLSLERVEEVAKRLNLLNPNATVITVGGTNGKGSCVAGLEKIYLTAGYRVGAFTSPILLRHNEYVRIQGVDASDDDFCDAFEAIDKARGDITLTPFEFNALAAFIIFKKAELDIWILEVGLGGRFDAVNVIDADATIVASIGIDHVEWLGDTREKIAYEKAGIFRKNQFSVCGDFDPPKTLIDYANAVEATLFCQNQEFGFEKKEISWNWWSAGKKLENLPLSSLALQNMSSVLMLVELLQNKLPVSVSQIHGALASVSLRGRIQVIPGDITKIFDVSHNPASAEFLAKWMLENPNNNKTRAVFSMLADKDILSTINVLKDLIDEWHIAPLKGPRAASIEMLEECFHKANIKPVSYATIFNAYEAALKQSEFNDRVVVFGSFHTVSEIPILE